MRKYREIGQKQTVEAVYYDDINPDAIMHFLGVEAKVASVPIGDDAVHYMVLPGPRPGVPDVFVRAQSFVVRRGDWYWAVDPREFGQNFEALKEDVS